MNDSEDQYAVPISDGRIWEWCLFIAAITFFLGIATMIALAK